MNSDRDVNGYTWGGSPPPPLQQPPAPPHKRRRIFMWIFLAIQVIFVIWVIVGATSASGTPDDCGTLSREACNDAENLGTTIGVGFIIFIWAATDIILGFTYGIYRLARRG
ncbi:hypothetical protein ACFY7C_19770 [Streptomyces sp. NPDC012769]|uniref:hypothetical protein n=1 Tax=Streptomyces sp. NPDC012769 TaxID=3364848 RepID=UPI0036AF2D53